MTRYPGLGFKHMHQSIVHLHRYLGEFEFRYNTRWLDDGDRTMLAIQAADGRRLTYQQQVAH